MAHIVVMGAGIGGVAAAIEVREGLAKQHQVTVVSELENFQFTPSNPVARGAMAQAGRTQGAARAGLQEEEDQFHSRGREARSA